MLASNDYRGLPEPETAAFLEAVAASKLPPLHWLEPAAAREAFHARVEKTNLPHVPVEHITDMSMNARDGSPLRLRLYRHGSGEEGTLLYFHGGGFVIGSIETHDPICRLLAVHSGWSVLSVDYRLAPEHRFPAAAHDAIDSFDWLRKGDGCCGVAAGRIAVAGDSAGGTLAAVVAQYARLRGHGLARQILIYPALDQGGSYESRTRFGDGYLLTQEYIKWFAQHYYGDDRIELHTYASPARAADLAGLAPATIVTAELDPLRDEAASYAARLRAAHVSTEYRCVAGVIHGFLGTGRYVSAARNVLLAVADDLNRRL